MEYIIYFNPRKAVKLHLKNQSWFQIRYFCKNEIKKFYFVRSTGAKKNRQRLRGRVVHPGCDPYVKSALWIVSCSSLEATASKTSTPKEKQHTSGGGSHLPALSPSSPFDKATARGHQSSVCMCVCATEREEKGKENEKMGSRRDITDSTLDHLFRSLSLWTALL